MPSGRWLVLLGLAVLPIACNKANSTPATGAASVASADVPVTHVKVASPKRVPLAWSIEQPGTVMAFEVTPVVAKIPGYVKEIAADPVARQQGKPDAVIDMGSEVTKGQLLATLDIPELDAEATQKRAAVDQATAELELARKDVRVAESQVSAALVAVREAEAGVMRAGTELDRWKTELVQSDELVARKVIDIQSRDVTFKQFRAAESARGETVARVNTADVAVTERRVRKERAEAEVLVASAKLKVAEAAVKEVEARLTYTRITAPFDGIVTSRMVHTRHFVQPPSSGQTQVLFTVASLEVVRVFVDVPEVSSAKAGPGAKATVRVPALANREYAAEITRTGGVVQPETRTLRTEIDVVNKDRLLKPGMYAVVQIQAATADATVLPAACVLPADETHYVYLVEAGRAVKYRVQVGRTDGGNVQVLGRRRATATGGNWEEFAGSEKVVVGNLGALTDGAAVEVRE